MSELPFLQVFCEAPVLTTIICKPSWWKVPIYSRPLGHNDDFTGTWMDATGIDFVLARSRAVHMYMARVHLCPCARKVELAGLIVHLSGETRTHTEMHRYASTCLHACMSACIHVHTHTNTCRCSCIHAHVHTFDHLYAGSCSNLCTPRTHTDRHE